MTAAAVQIILFGAFLSVLMALAQVTRRERDRLNNVLCVLLVCVSVLLVGVCLVVTGQAQRRPEIIFMFVAAVYCAGPLCLLYYRALLGSRKPVLHDMEKHFLPGVIVVAYAVWFSFRSQALRERFVLEVAYTPESQWFTLIIVIGSLHVLTYLAYLMRTSMPSWKLGGLPDEVRFVAWSTIMVMAAVFLLNMGYFLSSAAFFLAGGLMITLIIVTSFLAFNRYPYFFQVVRKELKKKKYERSLIKGLDTDLAGRRLEELMTEEQVFTDMDLNLQSLATMLSMTPHQLSQFLNEKMSMDFRSFVNAYRVEEAKKQLLEKPDDGVLAICFDVGFSSKSTFNNVFKKMTGKTPTQFRAEGG